MFNANKPVLFSARPSARVLALAFVACFATSAQAVYTWNNVQFGAFVSQGYLSSSANDYIGETSEGTFEFREYAASASWASGRWRIGGQVFGQHLGAYGHDKIKLDWATIDFQPAQWFGIRGGRVKMPRGLYNEALDVDAVRPFVLLPQSVYDPRLRDFNASFDGGLCYGNVPVGRAGSFDYKVFYGKIPVDASSGANDYFNSDRPFYNLGIEMDSAVGGSLFWNPPVSGLRVGYSFSQFDNLTSLRSDGSAANLHTKTAGKYPRHQVSAEYITGSWTFATEYSREKGKYFVNYLNRFRQSRPKATMEGLYVSAARRLGDRWEVGAYYDRFKEVDVLSSGTLKKHQTDHALSVRFDVNENVILKVEAHYYDGAGKIFDLLSKPQPPALLDQRWTMIAAKATLLF